MSFLSIMINRWKITCISRFETIVANVTQKNRLELMKKKENVDLSFLLSSEFFLNFK